MAHSIRDLLGDQGGTRHNKLSKVLDAIGVRGGEPVQHRMTLGGRNRGVCAQSQ